MREIYQIAFVSIQITSTIFRYRAGRFVGQHEYSSISYEYVLLVFRIDHFLLFIEGLPLGVSNALAILSCKAWLPSSMQWQFFQAYIERVFPHFFIGSDVDLTRQSLRSHVIILKQFVFAERRSCC